MSLKAKVEAVVYAAEEPVTLAQLSAIFAGDVLEALAAAEAESLQAAASGEEDRPESLEAESPEAGNSEAESSEPALWEEPFSAEEPAGTAAAAPAEEPEPAGETQGSPEAAAAAPETDEKKAARQRDRRVREELQRILDALIADYAGGQRGMEIREIAGGYRMATKPEYHDAVRGFVKSLKPPMKLSLQALETLAVIAYKQPVTAPEVSEIRGVDSGGVLGSLIGRKLITTAGRKHVIGRPILYKTTKEFLLRFGLKDLNELPSMEEFEKMAGELAQAEAEAEDAAMRSAELPLSDAEPGAEPAAEPSAEPTGPMDEAEAEEPAAEETASEAATEADDQPAGESGGELPPSAEEPAGAAEESAEVEPRPVEEPEPLEEGAPVEPGITTE